MRDFLPKKGAKNSLNIESILKNFKTIINTTISDANSQVDVDIQFSEVINLFKTTTADINYKLEALTLIISELLKKYEFDQAEEAYSQYSVKLKELIQEIDISTINILENFINNAELPDSTRKLYRNRLSDFEKDWKNQKRKILGELSKLKRSIAINFDKWIAKSKRNIEKNISTLNSFETNVRKKFSKFSELIHQKNFTDAEQILKRTEKRAQTEIKNQKAKLNQTPLELGPLLGDLITKWKEKISKIEIEIPQLLDPLRLQLTAAIITENITALKSLSSEMHKKVTVIPSLLEQKRYFMVETLLRVAEAQFQSELETQKESLHQFFSEITPELESFVATWDTELANTESEINNLLNPLKTKVEASIIEESVLTLEQFSSEANEKISTITGLFEQEKFAIAEKGLKNLEKAIISEFKKQKETLSQRKKGISPAMDSLLDAWKNSLEKTEKKLQNLIFEIKNKYIQLHIPHLLNKVDLLIQQNVEFLYNFLEDYQKKAMTHFKSHFDEPIESIRQLIKTLKKTFLQELNNKEDHVQLVFARYESYPLEEKKQQWANESRTILDRFNEIQTKIFSLLEDRDQINKLLDKYYEIAQPAYGYKVPITVLSEILEIPEDRLEFLFVELISHEFVSGEIDPVTKVIVLAPRVPPEKKRKRKMQQLRCMVCNLTINPSKEEIVYCPHCNSPAHRTHLIEWIKIKSTCPNCKRTIKIL